MIRKIGLAAALLLGSVACALAQFIGGNALPTYSAAVAAFGNSSAGDVFCISGSATKTVYVKIIQVSAVASAAISDDVTLIKRSTADTGGTPTAVTLVPNDSANPAGTATVTAYGTAPTAGTTVGTMRSQVLGIATTTSSTSVQAQFQFAVYWEQPVTLHGAAENVCVNVPATAGGQWSINEEHSEGPIITFPIQ